MLTADGVVRLLAEPARLQVLAAVALGATGDAAIVEGSGLPAKAAHTALRKLRDQELVVSDERGHDVVNLDQLRLLARAPSVDASPEAEGDSALRPFVRKGRLVQLPTNHTKRRTVLEHLAAATFAAEQEYDERAVNDLLREWCEHDEVDHVTLRRYLVDLRILTRADGVYRVGALVDG